MTSEYVCSYDLTLRKWFEGLFHYDIFIRIGQDISHQEQAKMTTNYANKFDDEKSSDFKVKCKNVTFHAHQWILADRSEYFSMIFRNDCLEMKKKELTIEDFEPHVVKSFLKYIYNGTLLLPMCNANFENMI